MLPPGQREIDGFPRFGVPGAAPTVPADPVITVTGPLTQPLTLSMAALTDLPRRELVADFHCVAGWTARDLRWEGVPFADFYRLVIEPALPSDTSARYAAFMGLDGFRSIALLEDVLAPDVLIADTLNGLPLDIAHGAPARLLSPQQYGFISTKHLVRIELHASRPHERYHPNTLIQLGLQAVKPHPRARVWAEERHALLPGRLLRPAYRRLIPVFRRLSARRRRGESPPSKPRA